MRFLKLWAALILAAVAAVVVVVGLALSALYAVENNYLIPLLVLLIVGFLGYIAWIESDR
jgi:hypothetical protein